ncbi:MAG: GNAT family N-acetyltransferase [Bacteroidales bacterium]|nr:GNAT family N-acetyltransferase [Bacteroidales bacterium]
MDTNYSIRRATIKDVTFLADVIIGAEKSLTENIGLATVFELSEERLRQLIIAMLEEEVDGCEFSISSFFVTCYKEKPVAAIGGWLECYYDNMPSSLIKSNLIGFVFPRENILKAQEKSDIIKGLQFEREKGTYQLEYGYVAPNHRGKEIFNQLMKIHLDYAKQLDPNVKKAQTQAFENNKSAIITLEQIGFRFVKKFVSQNKDILNYMPFNVKVLMEKSI